MTHTEAEQDTEMRPATLPEEFAFEDEHPQLKVPFSAIIDDRKLEGTSLSLTKAEVSGLLAPSMADREELVSLRFDFDGFSVNLFAEAAVKFRGESEDPKISLVFTDPMGDHLPPLRYILNSFIAGDLVSIGPMLGFTGPTQIKKSNLQASPSFLNKASKLARTLILGGLGVAMVFMAGSIVFNRFAFKYEASPITLTQDGDLMRATASGQITYINTDAAAGEVAYSISANSGDLLSTKMPCDCEVLSFNGFFDGATVLAGDPVMKLVSEGTELVADTQLSSAGAVRFIQGDQPEIELQNGTIVPVKLTFVDSSASANVANGVAAKIELVGENANLAQTGQVARLRFHNKVAFDIRDFINNYRNLATNRASEISAQVIGE